MNQRVVGLPAYVASLAPHGVEDARRLGIQMFAAQAVRQPRLLGVDDARLEDVTDLPSPGRVTA